MVARHQPQASPKETGVCTPLGMVGFHLARSSGPMSIVRFGSSCLVRHAIGNDRSLRALPSSIVGHERPLSRQRCASTPIGIDLVQGGRGARGGLVQCVRCGRSFARVSLMVGHKTVVEGRSPPIIDLAQRTRPGTRNVPPSAAREHVPCGAPPSERPGSLND